MSCFSKITYIVLLVTVLGVFGLFIGKKVLNKKKKGSSDFSVLPKDDNKVMSRLLVSQADLSRIIGKGGQTVTNIGARCGAVIKGFNLEDSENKLVVIGGSMEEVLQGFDLVSDVLYEPFLRGTVDGNFRVDMLVDDSRVSFI